MQDLIHGTGNDDDRRQMTLIEIVEKAANADPVRDMLAFAADRVMDGNRPLEAACPMRSRSAMRRL